jgi:flagellar hook assembly protein FlgD
LTDEEWKTLYAQAPSIRPNFVNLYMANNTGESLGEPLSLITGVQEKPVSQTPSKFVLHQNFPNPFNPSTVISFGIPPSLSNSTVEITIIDIQGRVVSNVLKQQLPAGSYSVKWNGTSNNGVSMSSGVYFYQISVGTQRQIGKMVLLK